MNGNKEVKTSNKKMILHKVDSKFEMKFDFWRFCDVFCDYFSIANLY